MQTYTSETTHKRADTTPTEFHDDFYDGFKGGFKRWAVLGLFAFGIWVFGFVVGPYIMENVDTYKKIAQVVEEQDIDASAYFYTEIKGSAEGEAYLRQALQTGAPDQYGFTWPFISGIVLCLVILAIGFRYLPNEHIPAHGEEAPPAGR